MVYLILFILTLIGVFFYDILKSVRFKGLLYNVILIFSICVSAFAYRLGTDAVIYEHYFDEYITTLPYCTWNYLTDNIRFNFGFVLFATICKTVCSSYVFFKLIFSIVVNVSVFVFIKRYSQFRFITLLFYLCASYLYFNFEIYREALAVSVFLFSIPYLIDKKYLKYFLMVFIAVSFHNSALILLFVPLLSKIKFNQKNIFIAIALFASLIAVNSYFKEFIQSVVMLSDRMSESYQSYFESEHYGDSILSVSRIYSYVFHIVLPIVILAVFRYKKQPYRFEGLVFLDCLIFLVSQIFPILFRFSNYTTIITLLFYIDMFWFFASAFSNKKIIFVMLSFFYIGLTTYRSFSNEVYGLKSYERYIPYSSIFTKDIYIKREMIYKR